jgi:hypothetical protein
MKHKTLVIGWFSFELMGASAGDFIAKDLACKWLDQINITPDVAMAHPAGVGEIATVEVVPEDYHTVVFVCGPIGDGPPLNEFLDRFPHARKFALNVSLLQSRAEWNPFVAVIERDSSERVNPDMTFGASNLTVPTIGQILVGPQKEYLTQRHDLAEETFMQIVKFRDIAVVPIDTRLDVNLYGLSSPAQIESAIAKMDAVLTTRLHGAALALRRHVPPVVIDAIPGGAKLYRQMQRIGWPLAFHTGDLDAQEVAAALDYALTPEARRQASECARAARQEVEKVHEEFIYAVSSDAGKT